MEANNMAAMRETLNDIVRIARLALNINCVGNSNNSELWSIIDKCKSALAEPPRNCDVYNTRDKALKACFEDREYCSSPIDERKSVISFMLSGQEEVVLTNKEGADDEQK